MIRRHSSGSLCSASSIEPITAANSTVTCLRSPSREVRPARIFLARCSGVFACGSRPILGPRPPGVPGSSPVVEVAPLSACPQALQNFFPVGFLAPHLEHSATATSDAPQPPQKRAPSGFSSPQDRQIISVHGAYAHERGPCPRASPRSALTRRLRCSRLAPEGAPLPATTSRPQWTKSERVARGG